MNTNSKTTELVDQLKRAHKNGTGTAAIVRHFGMENLEELNRPLCQMNVEKSTALVLNWILYKMPRV